MSQETDETLMFLSFLSVFFLFQSEFHGVDVYLVLRCRVSVVMEEKMDKTGAGVETLRVTSRQKVLESPHIEAELISTLFGNAFI